MQRALPLLLVVFVLLFSATASEARTLQRGMSGADVRALQEDLSRIPGIFNASPTGYFGTVTETAVRTLQKREGIVSSGSPETTGYGLVGPRTLAKIRELTARAVSSRTSPPAATTPVSTTTPAQATSTPIPATTAAPSTPPRDTTPPVRSKGSPTGVLPISTSQVTITVTTSEAARCYWSNVPRTSFDYMTSAFGVTGGTVHTTAMTWQAAPGDYAFYVRCRDGNFNTNTTDYPIIFSIEHPQLWDTYPPRVFMSYPTGEESITEGFTTLSAVAADDTTIAHVRFFLRDQDLGIEDATPPHAVSVLLTPGAYTVFAVAQDKGGNRATSSPVAFSVTPKPASAAALPPVRSLLAQAIRILEFLPFNVFFWSR